MNPSDRNLQPVIGAIVLAAGLSTRMGQPKMVMPWGANTVIGQVVSILSAAGTAPIVVVTGGARDEVEKVLSGQPVKFAYNSHFANGEMLDSVQVGIRQLDPAVDGFLLILGDQPQIELEVVRKVMSVYFSSRPALVVPSVHMRRGHPWLVDRALWSAILDLKPPQTMRDFLHQHSSDITYLDVETTSILMDLDTPDDYHRLAPD